MSEGAKSSEGVKGEEPDDSPRTIQDQARRFTCEHGRELVSAA
jgi:hypothetical protein